MSNFTSSSEGPPLALIVCTDVIFGLHGLVSGGLLIYHIFRLCRLWRSLPLRDWLLLFHSFSVLACIGFLGGAVIYFVFGASHGPEVTVVQTCFYGLGAFGLSSCAVFLGFFSWKETVYAKHGPRRWATARRPAFVVTCVQIIVLLGSTVASAPFVLKLPLLVDNNAWLINLTTVLAPILSSVFVVRLALTLRFTQRVLPFLSTRLLLLPIVLQTVGFVLGLFTAVNLDLNSAGIVPWICVLVMTPFFDAALAIWAFLFRGPPPSREGQDELLRSTF